MYIAHRRRQRRRPDTREALAAKTRQLIQEHTTFMEIAEDVPVYRIDANYLVQVARLPSPADRAAELEAALTREIREGEGGFLYKKLGERLEQVIRRKEAGDQAAIRKLEEYQALVEEINKAKAEPERLGLTAPGEFPLFVVIRDFAQAQDEALCVRAAKGMMASLRRQQLLPAGWADNRGGRNNVSLALQTASWEPEFGPLGLCPEDRTEWPFLTAAVEELARTVK